MRKIIKIVLCLILGIVLSPITVLLALTMCAGAVILMIQSLINIVTAETREEYDLARTNLRREGYLFCGLLIWPITIWYDLAIKNKTIVYENYIQRT